MSASLEFITFEGRQNEDVSSFLQNVKRIAFSQGRQRDDEWLSDYVETCLAGVALKWYSSLSKDTQRDFSALRVVMLEKFIVAPAPIAPPQAPPAAAPARRSSSDSFPRPGPSRRVGRLTVVRNDNIGPGFVGPERYNEAAKMTDCGRALLAKEAMTVEWIVESDNKPGHLKVVPKSGSDPAAYLGLTYWKKTATNTARFWALCLCDEGILTPYPRATCTSDHTKEAASKVWKLDPRTSEVTLHWTSPEGLLEILELRSNKDGHLWLRSLGDGQLESATKARLYFQPL